MSNKYAEQIVANLSSALHHFAEHPTAENAGVIAQEIRLLIQAEIQAAKQDDGPFS